MEEYPIALTETSTSGLAATRSAASALFGAPLTLALGPAKAPGMNCGRKFEHDILTSDLGSIKAVSARAEFTLPGAPSLVYRKPSFEVLAPHAAGSTFATHGLPTFAQEKDATLLHVSQAWQSPRVLP
jgi:hypothetical protein